MKRRLWVDHKPLRTAIGRSSSGGWVVVGGVEEWSIGVAM